MEDKRTESVVQYRTFNSFPRDENKNRNTFDKNGEMGREKTKSESLELKG